MENESRLSDEEFLASVQKGYFKQLPTPIQPAIVAPEQPSAWRRVPDIGVTGLKGAVGLAEAGVGLADIPTGGAIGRGLEKAGVRFKDTQQALSEMYSPQQQAAQQAVSGAFKEGFIPGVTAAIRHPSTIATTIGESLPSIAAGGVAARGIKAATGIAPWLAGTAGEGLVGAGSAAERIRQETESGYLEPKGVVSALGSGLGTAAFGALGGKMAQKLGVRDIETAIAGGVTEASKKGFLRRAAEGGFTEGVLEELPQSVQEQMWQNYATGKPLTEGVSEAAGMGLLSGGVMGAGVGALPGRAPKNLLEKEPTVQPAEPIAPGTQAGLAMETPIPAGAAINKDYYLQLRKLGADHQSALDASILTGEHAAAYEDAQRIVSTPTEAQGELFAPRAMTETGAPLTYGVTRSAPDTFKAQPRDVVAPAPANITGLTQKPGKRTPRSDLAATLDDHLEQERITPEQHAEQERITPEQHAELMSDVQNPKAKPEKIKQNLVKAIASNAPAVAPASVLSQFHDTLPAQQKAVFGLIQEAANNNELDKYVAPDGQWQATAMGETLGISKSAAHKAVRDLRKKLNTAAGKDVKAALAATTAARRTVETAPETRLGLSPAEQAATVSQEELFGTEGGATQGMGTIETVGGSQGDVGELTAPPGYMTDYSINERAREAAQESKMRAVAEAVRDGSFMEAVNTWNDFVGSVDGITEISANLLADENNLDFISELVNTYQDVRNEVSASQDAGKFIDEIGAYEHEFKRIVRERKRSAEKMAGLEASKTGLTLEEKPKPGGITAKDGVVAEARTISDKDIAYKKFLEKAAKRSAMEFAGQDILDSLEEAGISPEAVVNQFKQTYFNLPAKAQEKFLRMLRPYALDIGESVPEILDGMDNQWPSKIATLEGTERGLIALMAESNHRYAAETAPIVSDRKAVTKKSVARTTGKPPSAMNTAEEIMAALEKAAFSKERLANSVVIVDDEYGLPAATRDELLSYGEKVQAFFEPTLGKVYLIASNMPKGKEVAVMLHEVGVHMGMRKLLGAKKYESLVTQLQAWTIDGTGQEGELAREAYRRVKKAEEHMGELYSQEMFNEELMAYFVEEAVNAGVDIKTLSNVSGGLKLWLSNLLSALRSVIRSLGINPDALTAQDVVALAYGAAHMQLESGVSGTPAAIKASFASATKDMASRVAGKGGEKAYTDTAHVLKKAVGYMTYLHDLVNKVKKTLPSAQVWYDGVLKMQEARLALERDAELVAKNSSRLDEAEYKRTNDFIGESTASQKWGYTPEWNKDVMVDPEMKKAWDKLTPDGRTVVDEVFKHGHDAIVRKQELFKKLGVTDVLSQFGAMKGPYAPLKRFGKFVGVAKSQQLVDAEKALEESGTKANEDAVATLRKNPAHLVVSSFDTPGMAEQFAKEHADKFAFTDHFASSERVGGDNAIGYKSLEKVMSAIKADPSLPASVRTEMENMVRALYLSSVDEHNARQSGQTRKNIAGYDADMIRSFLAGARADASFIASLEHGGEINDAFYKVQQDAKDPATGRRIGQDDFNLLAQHYAENVKYDPSPWNDAAVGLTSAWQLSTSLGYHLQNMLQGVMVTVPRLAADYSYARAWKEFMGGYGQLKDISNGMNVDLSKIADEGLRESLELAANRGLLDVGIEEDMGHLDRIRTGYKALDGTSGFASSALHKLRSVSRMIETWNRVSSGTAAYNLAIKSGKSPEQAKAYVIDVLQSTQGDFSRAGAPLLLKKIPKVMAQYRKYQFMMMAFYVKAFNQAFYGASPQERAIGRRMLAFKLFHTSLAAGVLGLPLINMAAIAMSMAGGDDDPEDLEMKLRKSIGNKELADLLLNGVTANTPIDMSAKLGEQNVFAIAPYTDFDLTSKTGVASTFAGIAGGPALAQIGKMADGVGLMQQGQLAKGIEKTLPTGIASAMSAFRTANEGYTIKNGDVIVKPQDMDALGLAFTFAGLPSAQVKELTQAQHIQYSLTKYFDTKTKDLERQYLEAYKDHDSAKMMEIRGKWRELQSQKDEQRVWFNRNPQQLKRTPISTLTRYPNTVRKRELKEQRSYAQT